MARKKNAEATEPEVPATEPQAPAEAPAEAPEVAAPPRPLVVPTTSFIGVVDGDGRAYSRKTPPFELPVGCDDWLAAGLVRLYGGEVPPAAPVPPEGTKVVAVAPEASPTE